MAELHVERKDQSAWPWILAGIILLALVLWFIFGRSDGTVDSLATTADTTMNEVAPAAAAPVETGVPAAVTTFVQFADSQAVAASTGPAHDYTADGLRRLTAALSALTDRDTVSAVAIEPRLTEIRQLADAMQQTPQSTEHARQTREAFVTAASLMEQLQTSGFTAPANSLTEVRSAAESIQPGTALLEQTDAVRRFFEHSAAAVRGMSGM